MTYRLDVILAIREDYKLRRQPSPLDFSNGGSGGQASFSKLTSLDPNVDIWFLLKFAVKYPKMQIIPLP